MDIHCSLELPEWVLIQRRVDGYEFCAYLFYEFIPYYCHDYGIIGHKQENYKRRCEQNTHVLAIGRQQDHPQHAQVAREPTKADVVVQENVGNEEYISEKI